jgi:hypothetical protein
MAISHAHLGAFGLREAIRQVHVANAGLIDAAAG